MAKKTAEPAKKKAAKPVGKLGIGCKRKITKEQLQKGFCFKVVMSGGGDVARICATEDAQGNILLTLFDE